LESLIKAGALDSLGWKRSQLFHLLDTLIEYGHQRQKAREEQAFLLFSEDYLQPPEIPAEIHSLPEWEEEVLLAYEKEVLGTYLSSHPLARYKKRLNRLISHTVEAIDPEEDFDREVRLAGIVVSVKLLKTKKEERMAAFVLEDLSGQIDVTVFPEPYSKYHPYLKEGQLIWVKGRMSIDSFDARKVLASQILPLEEALEKLARKTIIRLPLDYLSEEDLSQLHKVLASSPGECPLYLELEKADSVYLIQSAEYQAVSPSEAFLNEVEALLGPDAVLVEY
ncbi:MAG: hypothetical protein H5U07_06090, partial [Candidatus Aminicenantes bacterium]|nr:hypothetical protein [Candidatus Aminicenantes bacterium]